MLRFTQPMTAPDNIIFWPAPYIHRIGGDYIHIILQHIRQKQESLREDLNPVKLESILKL